MKASLRVVFVTVRRRSNLSLLHALFDLEVNLAVCFVVVF